MKRLLFICYFLSGMTSLMYEVIWQQKLGLLFGVDAYASATIVSVFLGGLAIGSFLGSRYLAKHSSTNPTRLYGQIELIIAFFAVISPLVFGLLAKIADFFWPYLGSLSSFNLLTIVGVSAALLVPTLLMGMTYPVVVAILSRDEAGWLYTINTFGAVVGLVLCGFFLIPLLGLLQTTYLAAIINVSIGVVLFFHLSRHFKQIDRPVEMKAKKQAKNFHINKRLPLFIFFLTGFAALSMEILWTRALLLFFGASIYAFVTILTIFLIGMAAGSAIGEWLGRWFKTNSLLLGLLVCLAVTAVGTTFALGYVPELLVQLLSPQNSSYLWVIGIIFMVSFMILIVPTVFIGILFNRLLSYLLSLGDSVGRAYGINTIGSVTGALCAGFILLPQFGLERSLIISALVYLVPMILLSRGFKIWLLALGLVLVTFLIPAWNVHLISSGPLVYYRDYLDAEGTLEKRAATGDILYYKEGLTATVMVKKAPEGFLFLRNNGKTDASTDQDLDDLHLIGILPILLHKDPQNVLVIGMGSGITAGSVSSYPVKQLDIVDIEPAVFSAAGYFGEYNNQVLKDPRVKTIATDARGYLLRQRQLFDVITSQPSNLWVKGNASLFSREFYQIAKERLKTDGLMLQWVPFYGFTESEFKTVLKTFMSVFPSTTMWTPVVSHDVLLVGSTQPQQYDAEQIAERLNLPAIAKDLKETGITTTPILLAHYVGDEQQLKSLTAGANIPLNTDNRPLLEYSNPFNMFKSTEKENLAQIMSIEGDYQQHVHIAESDESKVAEAKEAVLLTLGAKRKSAEDDLEGAAADFESALAILPKLGTKKELARLYFELAKRSYDKKDTEKTITYFQKSIEVYPTSQVYLNVSILYLSQNRLAKAKEALEQAKMLEPANPRIGEIEKNLIEHTK